MRLDYMALGGKTMPETFSMKVIAHMRSDFSTKFGVPRQSGLVEELKGRIIFEPQYRNQEAFRGLEQYSHIWLIWQFSEAVRENWSPTVRPPRLGGNTRMGVFATRSPFRPNPIALSSVKLEKIEFSRELGPVLHVLGADLMDNSPIYDIKPYLPYTDCHPEALEGFALATKEPVLRVEYPDGMLEPVLQSRREALLQVLAQDPRPAYQNEPDRVYGFEFAGFEVRFSVDGKVLKICEIKKL